MSVSSEVQRTLVKSPPELWAELSDPASLANHLGELGEIRIVRTVPETTVEWEAPDLTGSVQIKPSAWGTKVTLSVTQELSAPEPRTPSEQLEAKPETESGQGPAVSPGSQSPQPTPDRATRLEAGRNLETPEGGSPEGPASQHGLNTESAGPLHRDSRPGADGGSEGPLEGDSSPGADAGSGGSLQGDSRPGADAGSEGPPQGDSRPRSDPDTVDPVECALQRAPDPAAESAVGGQEPSADAELESVKSESELQRGSLTTAADPPEPVLTRRPGPFARAWRRLRGFQRFKTPAAASESAQVAGDVAVSGPTAVAPEEPTTECVVAGAGDDRPGEDQPGGEQGEPETRKTPADEAPGATSLTPADEPSGARSQTPADELPRAMSLTPADEPPGGTSQKPASGWGSEASEDAIADVQVVQPASAAPATEEQSDASWDTMAGAQAAQAVGSSPQAVGASPEQSAVESLASERATAVLISVLDRLGAAHHRPFSRG